MGWARVGLVACALAGLAGCAAQPEVAAVPDMPEALTVLGRHPAARHGILIAQNAALQEGRAICQAQGLRFRPLGSVAGEDPESGDAIYAVRFRCLPGRRAQAERPAPAANPQAMPKVTQ